MINFLRATGREGMFTVNLNSTPQEAAALVAFFNASTTDSTVIGVDRNGFDWQTAGHWAQLRADHGNPNPIGIHLWNFANEPYGSININNGPNWMGWENDWIHNGTEYINGDGIHSGYRQFRAAMRAVDPSIQLGVGGYTDTTQDYYNFVPEMLRAARNSNTDIDFYEIHWYPYQAENNTLVNTVGNPGLLGTAEQLTTVRQQVVNDLATFYGRQVPIWMTEYNLNSNDDQSMQSALNLLHVSDTIGQSIQNGFAGSLQWAFADGTTTALLHDNPNTNTVVEFDRSPSYFAFPLWNQFGNQMLSTTSTLDPANQLSVYGGRVDGDTISLIAINKTNQVLNQTISIQSLNGIVPILQGTADTVQASSLSATSVTYNGVSNPRDNLSNVASQALTGMVANGTLSYQFQPYSVTLLRFEIPTLG